MHPSQPNIKIIAIAAVDRNGALGRDGILPWSCPVDMRHFVLMTMGKIIVMGRRTVQGFKKPLRGRTNIVMSASGYEREGFDTHASVESVLAAAARDGVTELWIIGGAGVYNTWMPWVDLVHLTKIDVAVEDPDTYFPMDALDDFEGGSCSSVEDPLVTFWTMQRAPVGTGRDRVAPCIAMDLNVPSAFWIPS